MSDRPELGQRVSAAQRAHKNHYWMVGKKHTTWTAIKASVEGMYIGWRVCREGYSVNYGSWEEPEMGFTPEKTVELWLVIPNERSNPVYVFPDDVTIKD